MQQKGRVSVTTVECWNIRSLDYSFPGTFVPMMEFSFLGPFVPNVQHSFLGTNGPWNIRSLDRSFHGTFVPGTLDLSCRGPFVHLSAEQYLVTYKEGTA